MVRVILFDGYCNLCSASMRFVMRHSPTGFWQMVPLQGSEGRIMAARIGLDVDDPASVAVIQGDVTLTDSAAVLAIAGEMHRPWRWLAYLRVLPSWLLDPCYRLLARNRYRIAGRRECELP